MSFYQALVIASLILWILISSIAIVGLLFVLPRLLRALGQVEELQQKSLPVLDQTQHVLDQVGAVSTSLADDVERIDRTVIRTTESLESMIELAEERVSEINALLEVAIEETEETFFSTAAIMRALRLGGRGRKRRKLTRGERRRLG